MRSTGMKRDSVIIADPAKEVWHGDGGGHIHA